MAVATEYATGRRKCAIARAWVTGTAGDITVNDKPLEKAFPRLTLRQIIQLPLEMAGVAGKFSIKATVHGGGPTGQAGALRHAIARALVSLSQPLRAPLKKEGLLTRDSRVKERKKYGQKGARKRFQYSKR
ncbi:MAG TPA: 30S ribosomal protein S9 [Nitrospira sp.]|nr:30S ribosomal protein S9 [Nitrospira sp.]